MDFWNAFQLALVMPLTVEMIPFLYGLPLILASLIFMNTATED